jgi:hypothetical protein
MFNITTIIVTYSRKIDLLRCIKVILSQTHKPAPIVIIDNASHLNISSKEQIANLPKSTLVKLSYPLLSPFIKLYRLVFITSMKNRAIVVPVDFVGEWKLSLKFYKVIMFR